MFLRLINIVSLIVIFLNVLYVNSLHYTQYEYFTLVQNNPIASCWQEHTESLNTDDEKKNYWTHSTRDPNDLCQGAPQNIWTLRGLRPIPIAKDGSDPKCIDVYQLIKDPNKPIALPPSLERELNSKWLNHNNPPVWQKEYKKYGVCAQDVYETRDVENYFAKTLSLYDTYNVRTFLDNARIFPNNQVTYRIQDIRNAILRGTCGKTVVIKCAKDFNTNAYYLLSVHICFDKDFNLAYCRDYEQSDCPADVIYPKPL